MFTAVAQKSLANAEKYFDEHLAQNDYYAAGEIRPGPWIGLGAQRMELKNVVTRDQFQALCENRNPQNGERLTQRQQKEDKRRVFYDFTCSAPKSVSVLAVTFDDDRLVTAHEEASRIAFLELEIFAATRVRKHSNQRDRTTGNLAAAAFTHTSSRALDPLLHTHFTVFNATFDETERSWKALQAGGMYDAIRYGTAVYRNELARRVRAIGYRTIQAKHGFEIEGVSPEVLKRFFKRSQQRDAVVKEVEQKLGRKLSNNAVAFAVHQSRVKKIKGIYTAEVREQQLSQLTTDERELLQKLCASVHPTQQPRIAGLEGQTVDYAVAHVFERKSVVPEHELLNVALTHRPGEVDLDNLKTAVQNSSELVKIERGFSTRQILATELALIQTVNDGCDAVAPLHPGYQPADRLGDDQRRAIYHVLRTSDRIAGLRGLADTGQHSSVARGDALRILEQHSDLQSGQLTRIRRQRKAEYRKAVELAAQKRTVEAFAQLERMGVVAELAGDQIHESAAKSYLKALAQNQSALLIAPTWNEIEAVTDKVRAALKSSGRLTGEENEFEVFDSLAWTEAQKRDVRQYRPGMAIRFHRGQRRFGKDESVTVVAVENDAIKVQRVDGTETLFPLGAGFACDVGEKRKLKVAAGDKLLLQANAARRRFINGELVEVQAIQGDAILLTDGRVIPQNYRTFTHGYAITSHAAQGKTVDEVLVVASSRSLSAVSQQQFYVSISRGRERC